MPCTTLSKVNLYITVRKGISENNLFRLNRNWFRTEIRELQRSNETYDMRYFSNVPLCTSTVHDQSGDICIQGYLKDTFNRKYKIFKTRQNS